MFSTAVNTLEERAAFVALLARRFGDGFHEFAGQSPAARYGTVRIRGGQVVARPAAALAVPLAPEVSTVGFDLAALAVAFAERLHEADGAEYTQAQSEVFAVTLREDAPRSRRSLYYTTRAIFAPDEGHEATFNRVFADVFGAPVGADRYREQEHELEHGHRLVDERELARPVAAV